MIAYAAHDIREARAEYQSMARNYKAVVSVSRLLGRFRSDYGEPAGYHPARPARYRLDLMEVLCARAEVHKAAGTRADVEVGFFINKNKLATGKVDAVCVEVHDRGYIILVLVGLVDMGIANMHFIFSWLHSLPIIFFSNSFRVHYNASVLHAT